MNMINSKSSQQISYWPMRLLLFKLYSIRHAMPDNQSKILWQLLGVVFYCVWIICTL